MTAEDSFDATIVDHQPVTGRRVSVAGFCLGAQPTDTLSACTPLVQYLFVCLGHGIQRASVLEPLNLRGVEGMRKLDFKGRSILGMDPHRQRFSNSQLSAQNVDLETCQPPVRETGRVSKRTLSSGWIFS